MICILKDEQGGHTHAVGFDLELRLIYDCMEQCELVRNKNHLSHCCGDGKKFG